MAAKNIFCCPTPNMVLGGAGGISAPVLFVNSGGILSWEWFGEEIYVWSLEASDDGVNWNRGMDGYSGEARTTGNPASSFPWTYRLAGFNEGGFQITGWSENFTYNAGAEWAAPILDFDTPGGSDFIITNITTHYSCDWQESPDGISDWNFVVVGGSSEEWLSSNYNIVNLRFYRARFSDGEFVFSGYSNIVQAGGAP